MRACVWAALLAVAAAACKDAADCGFNGECDGGSGECKCAPPWKGPECQALDLKDASPGLHEAEARTSSWGGSVLHGDDGRLYMYAAEMVGHCGIQVMVPRHTIMSSARPACPTPTPRQ